MSKRAPRRSDEEWRQIILEARSCGDSGFEYTCVNMQNMNIFVCVRIQNNYEENM